MELGINSIIGIGLLLYGSYKLIMYRFAPEKLAKLESMKQEFSTKKAAYLFIFGYILLPFVAGLLILTRDYRG